MTNQELQEYLKQFPGDVIITGIIPTVTAWDPISKRFVVGEEGLTPMESEHIQYCEEENYILIYQEEDW